MTKLLQRLAEAKKQGWDEWIQNEADERAVMEGHCFDLAAAVRVRTFFTTFLRHSKGQWARQPFELLDWQWRSVVAPLFGWKRPDGSRRYRRGYIEVPKKNGKSALFSGLSLYLLAGDKEAGAEIYSAAVDRDQASIVFNEAANMVEESPQLTSRLQVVRSTKRIVFHRTRSFYKALSADVPAKEGLNAHAVLIDELHAQRTRDLWDTLPKICRSSLSSPRRATRTIGPAPRSGARRTPASAPRSTPTSSPKTARRPPSRPPRRTRSAATA